MNIGGFGIFPLDKELLQNVGVELEGPIKLVSFTLVRTSPGFNKCSFEFQSSYLLTSLPILTFDITFSYTRLLCC